MRRLEPTALPAALLLFAGCQGSMPFALINTTLARGERLALSTPTNGEVRAAPGSGAVDIDRRSKSRIELDGPTDPGLFLLHLDAAGETTSLLLRVDDDGRRRRVGIAARVTAPRPTTSDHELWQEFCEGFLDDDVRKASELRMVHWLGADPDDAHPFVIALEPAAWTPMVLAFGPGASSVDGATLASFLDEMIAVANHFEYAASGVDHGFVSDSEASRLRELVRQVSVVDAEAVGVGLPRQEREQPPMASGIRNVTPLVDLGHDFAARAEWTFGVEEVSLPGRVTIVLLRAARPGR